MRDLEAQASMWVKGGVRWGAVRSDSGRGYTVVDLVDVVVM